MTNANTWRRKAEKIVSTYQLKLINGAEITENFGQSAYRKYRDSINKTDLYYSQKADLCAWLTEELSRINQFGVII